MLPISLNFEKIRLLQVLRHIAVLFPGIVIVGAIAIAYSDEFRRFMQVPEFGYYVKLSLLFAAAYLTGFVLDEIVSMIVGFIFGGLAAWLVKSEKRRHIIDTLLLAVAPWRDANWQRLASVYLGPDLTPAAPAAESKGGPSADSQWRFWYLVIKASVPKLAERFIRTAMLADIVQTCSWALLIARIIVPGHHFLFVLVTVTGLCFLISGVNKLILIGVSLGYFASDLTGADLGAAIFDRVRIERSTDAIPAPANKSKAQGA
jgi:hypothetical protein